MGYLKLLYGIPSHIGPKINISPGIGQCFWLLPDQSCLKTGFSFTKWLPWHGKVATGSIQGHWTTAWGARHSLLPVFVDFQGGLPLKIKVYCLQCDLSLPGATCRLPTRGKWKYMHPWVSWEARGTFRWVIWNFHVGYQSTFAQKSTFPLA